MRRSLLVIVAGALLLLVLWVKVGSGESEQLLVIRGAAADSGSAESRSTGAASIRSGREPILAHRPQPRRPVRPRADEPWIRGVVTGIAADGLVVWAMHHGPQGRVRVSEDGRFELQRWGNAVPSDVTTLEVKDARDRCIARVTKIPWGRSGVVIVVPRLPVIEIHALTRSGKRCAKFDYVFTSANGYFAEQPMRKERKPNEDRERGVAVYPMAPGMEFGRHYRVFVFPDDGAKFLPTVHEFQLFGTDAVQEVVVPMSEVANVKVVAVLPSGEFAKDVRVTCFRHLPSEMRHLIWQTPNRLAEFVWDRANGSPAVLRCPLGEAVSFRLQGPGFADKELHGVRIDREKMEVRVPVQAGRAVRVRFAYRGEKLPEALRRLGENQEGKNLRYLCKRLRLLLIDDGTDVSHNSAAGTGRLECGVDPSGEVILGRMRRVAQQLLLYRGFQGEFTGSYSPAAEGADFAVEQHDPGFWDIEIELAQFAFRSIKGYVRDGESMTSGGVLRAVRVPVVEADGRYGGLFRFSATVGSRGEFEVPRCMAGRYRITHGASNQARRAGQAFPGGPRQAETHLVVSDDAPAVVEVVLVPANKVTVRIVTRSGLPFAHAALVMIHARTGAERTVIADAEGRVVLDRFPQSQTVTLSVYPPGDRRERVESRRLLLRRTLRATDVANKSVIEIRLDD